MSETTTSPDVMPDDLITRVGLYEAQGGDIVPITGWRDGWWVAEWDGIRNWYGSDGRQRFRPDPDTGCWDLVRWVAPLPESESEPETTSEQLAECEGQVAEYTPPDGWRVLQVGEMLQAGDEIVQSDDGRRYRTERAGSVVAANQRYIRRIEPQPQPQPEPQPDAELQIRLLQQANDSQAETIGRLLTEARDLNMEIGGLERRLSERDARIRDLETLHSAAMQSFEDANKANDALRAQVEKLLDLINFANQQVEAVRDDLENRLRAVSAEWATQTETIRRLQSELDAAQQMPQAVADRFEEGWNQGTARAVESIIAWLEPFNGCNSPALAALLIEALPDIMRHLTGLAQD